MPSFPGFAYNASETLLIIPHSLSFFDNEASYNNYTIDDFVVENKINILVDSPYHVSPNPDYSFVNSSLSIDRVWQTSIEDFKYLVKNSLNLERKILEGSIFLPKDLEWNITEVLENVAYSNNLTSMIWGDTSLYSNINVNIPSLEKVNTDLFFDMMIKTGTTIRDSITAWFRSTESQITFTVKVTSPLQLLLISFANELAILRNVMYISSIPLILISLYLLYFSLGLIEKRKRKITNIMKNRGTSKNQIRLIALNEIFTSGLIATLVGMVLSIPMVGLLLQSSGFLEFDMPFITLLLPSIWWYKLPLIGVLIAIDFNFLTYLLIINDPMNMLNSTVPLWYRYNLDIMITIIGLLYWLFIPNLELLINNNSELFYSSIGPISLVFLIIGLPLTISRIVLPIIGKILFKLPNRFELLKLAMKNLINHRTYTIQILLLLLSGLMLVSVSLIIPQTLNMWSYEQQMYDNGADIYVNNISPNEVEWWDDLDVPDVIGKTEIIKFNFVPSYWQVQKGDAIKQYTILGINSSTFSTAAYWSDNFSNETLESISQSLSTNMSIGMLSSVATHLNMGDGDIIQLRYGQRGVYYFDYILNTTFDFFPNLVRELPWKNSEGILQFPNIDLLATYELVEHLSTIFQKVVTRGAYLRIAESANIKDVISELEDNFKNIYHISFHSYANTEEIIGDQSNSFLIMVMNSMFLVTFLVNTSGIMYYVFITSNERRKEYGILKSLGMIRSQLAKMMIYELIIIFLLSTIFGVLAGFLISYGSFQIIFNSGLADSVIMMNIVFPLKQILIVNGLLVGVTIIFAIIPALIISRTKTEDVLRSI